MAVQFVSFTGHGDTNPTTSCSITLPTTAANDILVLQVINGGANAALTPGGTYNGSAWSVIGTNAGWTSGWGGIWWSRCTGDHSGQTVTFSGATDSISSGVTRVSGCITSGTPYDTNISQTTQGAGANMSIGGFNTTSFATLVFFTWSFDDNQAVTSPTKDSVAMGNLSTKVSGGGADSGVGNASLAQAATGFTGNFANTVAAGTNQGKFLTTFALRTPAPTYNDNPTGTVFVRGTRSELFHLASGVMSRAFDAAATDYIACSIGASNLSGDLTQAMLIRKVADDSAGSGTYFANHTSAGAAATYFGVNDSNQVYWGTSIAALRTSTITLTVADGWSLVVVSKAAGTSTPRLHILKQGGSWQHEDLSSTSGNPASQAGGSVQFGRVELLSSFASMQLAVAADWNVNLSDAQAAELSASSATNDWIIESAGLPRGLWQFNQAAVGTSVTDVTGNGADQTSRSGTTAYNDGPDPWTYLSAFHKENPTGTVVVRGSVTESQELGGPSYTDNPVGRVIVTGTKTESDSRDEARSGVLVVTGTRTESYAYPTATRSGTVVLAGTRTESKTAADSPSGTVVLSGTRTESRSAADTRSGVLVITGTRVESFVPSGATYNDTCSGTLVLAGTSAEQRLRSYTPTGGLVLRGGLSRVRLLNTAALTTDHWIDLSLGACNLTGAFTIAKLWNQPAPSSHMPDYTVCNVTGTGANLSDFKINFSENGNEFPPGGSLQLFTSGSAEADYCGGPGTQGSGNTHPEMRTAGYLDGWVIHVVSKPAGLEIPRYHIFKDGVWSHGDGFEPQADAPSQAGGFIRLMKFITPSGFGAFPGMFALLGEWNGQALTDAQAEELSVHGGSRDWLQNSAGAPAGLWQFNQGDVSTPVVDITGNGAEQQSITGTWVVWDGPGWDYETVYNDDVSGVVLVTGSRTESFIGPTNYTDTCSGTLVLSGTAASSASHLSSPSGVVVLSGTRVESWQLAGIFNDTTSGSLIVSGTRTESHSVSDSRSGVVVLAGSAQESRAATETRSGTVVVSGTKADSSSRGEARSGVLVITGSRTESYAVAGMASDSPSGTVIVAGTKAEAHIENPRPSGQLVITGTRTEAYSHSVSRSGTVVVTGSRTEFPGKSYTDTRSGNLIVSGTRVQNLSRLDTPYGSIYISGRVTENVSYVTALLGKVIVSGSASEQFVPSGAAFHYPSGVLTIQGTLEELHNRWDWVDGERWPADSDARWGEDVGERWNVDVVV